MKEYLRFSIGVLARLLGYLAERYGGWLLYKIGDGADYGLDMLTDLHEFLSWLLESVASQLCGRRGYAYDYEDDGRHGYLR